MKIYIDDVVRYLNLEVSPHSNPNSSNYNVRCPFCGSTGHNKYTMNINREKNFYNCFRCANKGGGGALRLYAKAALGMDLDGTNRKEVFKKWLEDSGNYDDNYAQRKKAGVYKEPMHDELEYNAIYRASDEVLDATYSQILEFKYFSLSKEHYQNLKNRGLSDEAISMNGYRSVCDLTWVDDFKDAWKIYSTLNLDEEKKKYARLSKKPKRFIVAGIILASALLQKGCTLQGVPGFYRLNNQWIFNLEQGMVIPTRNISGQIVGIQVRTKMKKLKYMTVSSKGLPDGVTEGIARVHFPVQNAKLCSHTEVWFTEGPLKADVTLNLMSNSVFIFALQGVASNRKELKEIFRILKEQGIEEIHNYFDVDKITNYHVMVASQSLTRIAKEFGLKVRLKVWDPSCCEQKFNELCRLAEKNNISIAHLFKDTNENIFLKTAKLTGYLNSVNLTLDQYWCDGTKGIDDYLLKQKKSCK